MIRFRTNPDKVIEAVTLLADRRPGLSYWYVLKLLYFAEKIHLQKYGRPITGDRYIAMAHGPVASVTYDLLRSNEFFDEDILAKADEAFERKEREDGHHGVWARRKPNLDYLSRTDVECLEEAVEEYADLPISRLREITHRDKAWAEAPRNGEMDVAAMIDEDAPNREDILRYLSETAAAMLL